MSGVAASLSSDIARLIDDLFASLKMCTENLTCSMKKKVKLSSITALPCQSYTKLLFSKCIMYYGALVSLFFIASQLYPSSVFVHKRRKRIIAINPCCCCFFRINKLPKAFKP